MKPALTPREWDEFVLNPDPDDDTPLSTHIKWARDEMGLLDPTQHGLAAVCLYGQPFGFTWEDRDTLQHASMRLKRDARKLPGAAGQLMDDYAEDLWSIADRIAALLPPRVSLGSSEHTGGEGG